MCWLSLSVGVVLGVVITMLTIFAMMGKNTDGRDDEE